MSTQPFFFSVMCLIMQMMKHFPEFEEKFKHFAFISHTSKVIFKILQARLQQYLSHELSNVQAGYRKGRGTRDEIANIHGLSKKQESSRKTSTSALLTTPKPLTVWITANCGKFWEKWEYRTTLPVYQETCIWVKK